MPLNLDTGAGEGGGGQFYDKLRFNAQGGVWFLRVNGEEKRFASGFKAIFDMATLSTGWSRYNGSFLDWVADPSLEEPAPKPELGSGEGDVSWKRSFKVLAYSKDAFGGTVEFTHSARTVNGAFTELYSAYEKQAAPGKVPVVIVDGNPAKVGDYYAPKWSIEKMVDRPAVLPPVRAAQEAAAPADDEEF